MSGILQPVTSSHLNVLEPSACKKKDGPGCVPPKPKERKYRRGVCVWIHDDDEVWCKATIVKSPGVNASMVVQHSRTGQEVDVKVHPNYPLLCGVSNNWKEVDDLTNLNPLHEAAVLECLRSRCKSDRYCTKAGITLVAINPFKEIAGLYDIDTVHQYRNRNAKEQAPHIFCAAEKAFSAMSSGVGFVNQSIIVSGESGAGKTWTARCLMKYLASVAVPYNPGRFEPSPADCIERRILQSNPLLEAFGNAATSRNQNSSRFGKYIQLQFDRGTHIVGASIQTYLLEKTRVVHQAEKECNFHIFYQLLHGATTEEQTRWGLTKGSSSPDLVPFDFLQSAERRQDETSLDLASTRNAMCNVGISDEQQQQIFQILSGILHLGNLRFYSDDDLDPCDIDDSDSDCAHSLEYASQLLGLDSKCLVQSVIFRQITASHSTKRKSVFMRPSTVKEASNRRDCIAKLIYARLFDWLVSSINRTTCAGKWYSFIGLLDIYGFESFYSNSLEQLCINYANEKLQQHFVTHFLRAEQEEYQTEGIPWSFCSFTDNRPCLDAIEGKISVFTLMNEECNLNRKSNPVNFSQRVLEVVKTKYISKPHRSHQQATFVIQHYAEPVVYDATGLIDKNKDHTPQDLVELLLGSKNDFVKQLVQIETSNSQMVQKKNKTHKPAAKTVVKKFKHSLDSLMSTLNQTIPHYIRCIKPNTTSQPDVLDSQYIVSHHSLDSLMSTLNQTIPHYIRCIKPNTTSQPDVLDSQYIVSQLRACGVLETIQISAAGFPTKIGYTEFWQRYKMLLCNVNDDDVRSDGSKSLCADIIQSVFGDEGKENHVTQALYGNNKIFLPDGQLEQLECVRAEVIVQSAIFLQRCWRRYLERREMVMDWAATTIQAAFRGWKTRCDIEKMHDAATVIQHAMLMYCIRKQEERQLSEQNSSDTFEEVECENTEETPVHTATTNENTANTISTNVTLGQSNQFKLTMPGYSRPAVYSGISVLQASTSPIKQQQTQRTNSDDGYFDEEIDGIIDEDDGTDDDDGASQTGDGALMRILKTPAVDIAMAVTITALLVRGPLNW
ncbi:unconventional myosin-XIX-like [Amphiura filiformis]|uniref:unconventional myosin-XIX-like n=1 Tax=Amphiura filiformis TaxID=82378 RepID=UPI003B223163